MNAADVVGYVYDGDMCCVTCIEKETGGTAIENWVDSQGNVPSPIFADGDDALENCPTCDGGGTCGRCICEGEHDCGTCEGTGKVSKVCADCGEELIS